MTERICWIDVAEDAGPLAKTFDHLRREDGTVHNLYRAFSQFPAPVVSADRFYREIMHTPDAPLPMWLAELLSVDVAMQNDCEYAARHHGKNFIDLFTDREQAKRIFEALKSETLDSPDIDERLRALLSFGRKLTKKPEAMTESDVEALRAQDFSDAEISQAVQVTASFAYWTRFINAIGLTLGNEKVGKYSQPKES